MSHTARIPSPVRRIAAVMWVSNPSMRCWRFVSILCSNPLP